MAVNVKPSSSLLEPQTHHSQQITCNTYPTKWLVVCEKVASIDEFGVQIGESQTKAFITVGRISYEKSSPKAV